MIVAFTQVFSNPSADGPVMAFNNGQTTGQTVDSSLPDISETESAWQVTEWDKLAYLQPSAMTSNNPSTNDPLYGNAAYTWQASDGLTALSVYNQGGADPYVYDLQSSNGVLTASGGANLFLSEALQTAVVPTFDHSINYSVDAKISLASITYGNSTAQSSGAVQAEAFTGFTVEFNRVGSANYDAALPTYTGYMQIVIDTSKTDGAPRESTSARVAAPRGPQQP
jgi:hypothetical protein